MRIMMNTQQILTEALQLKATEKISVIETLLNSLDQPDAKIEEIWNTEAENRLLAYREGRLKGVSMEQIFTDKE